VNPGVLTQGTSPPTTPYGLLGRPTPVPMPAFRPAFDPRSILGLQGWWDSADLSTMAQNSNGTRAVVSANDPVGYWADKSGNDRHATQTTNNNRPQLLVPDLNARAALLFDGTNDYMVCRPGGACQLRLGIAVVRRTGTPIGQWEAICNTDANNAGVVPLSAQNFIMNRVQQRDERFLFGQSTSSTFGRRNGQAVTFVNSNSFNVFHGQFLPNTVEAQIIVLEGASAAQAVLGTQHIAIGCGVPANNRIYPMRLYELLLYDTFLQISQVQQVEQYLSNKWGIALA